MKGFVYFFRHNNIKGVKIGFTTSETVYNRFSSFKTYSPNGAEILGFIKTDNANELESELHKIYAPFRMEGEFFNIDETTVNSIISKFSDDDTIKIKKLFAEWIANPDNNITILKRLFQESLEINNYIKVSDIERDKIHNELMIFKKTNNIETLMFTPSDVRKMLGKNYRLKDIKKSLELVNKSEKNIRYNNFKGESKTGRAYKL